jgi:hypothetical protein
MDQQFADEQAREYALTLMRRRLQEIEVIFNTKNDFPKTRIEELGKERVTCKNSILNLESKK